MILRLSDFFAHGAILRLRQDVLCRATGPFRRVAAPPPGTLAFYAPDFFLRDEAPWYLPESFADEDPADFMAALDRQLVAVSATGDGALQWRAPFADDFATGFREVHRRIENDRLDKAVPIAIERAEGSMTSVRMRSMIRKLLSAPAELIPYGLWENGAGILGATPEILASGDGTSVRTMALAGTRPRQPEGTAWDDPKEIREHEVVVTSIVEALTPLGSLACSERRILSLPTMDHWLTEITLTPTTPLALDRLVAVLHPTPALGVAPRAYGYQWLEALDRDTGGHDRGRFGAPFGVVRPDGTFFGVVAIRNVQWGQNEWRLASGCGVIRESRLEREWEELALKRRSVKGLLAL